VPVRWHSFDIRDLTLESNTRNAPEYFPVDCLTGLNLFKNKALQRKNREIGD
jgi:hypothetical protein